jgi:hypothetical protein
MSGETTTDFTAVDSKDPGSFMRFLDAGNRQTTIGACKQIVLDALRLREGSRALDLGCGLASIVSGTKA